MSGNNYHPQALQPNQKYDAKNVWGTETRGMSSGSLSDEIDRITKAREQLAFPYAKPQDCQLLQTGPMMSAFGDYSGFQKGYGSIPMAVHYDSLPAGGASIPTNNLPTDNATLNVLIQDVWQVMQSLTDKIQAIELAVQNLESKQ